MIPARVHRIEVRDGEVLYRDLTAPRHPQIWLHALELSAENIATREELAGGRPATVNASAKLGKSGDMTLFVSANPFAKRWSSRASAALEDWKVAELFDPDPADDQAADARRDDERVRRVPRQGRRDHRRREAGAEERARSAPTEDDFGNKLKAWVADKGLRVFSDRVPDRNAVATVVPIKGRLDDPDIQLWPAVLGVIRNAFVEGISSGFSHLPPPTAEKPEGEFEQAERRAEKDEGPPEAQPTRQEAKKGGSHDGAAVRFCAFRWCWAGRAATRRPRTTAARSRRSRRSRKKNSSRNERGQRRRRSRPPGTEKAASSIRET